MKYRVSVLVWAGVAVVQMWIIVLMSQWIYINDHSLKPEALKDQFVLFISQATVGFLCDLYVPYFVSVAYVMWIIWEIIMLKTARRN
ncbi:MAG: hypothetical protein WCJ07_08825 [Verrucomicrobiota bacterium]